MTQRLNLRPGIAAALSASLLGLASLAVQANEPRTFAHAQGSTAIPAVPQKAAVLSTSTLDTVHALGIDVAVVPGHSAASTARWPERLIKEYTQDKYTKLSSGQQAQGEGNPLVDAITSAKPDLVIVEGRSRNSYKDLQALAPTVDLSVSNAAFVNSVAWNVLTLGAIFGQEQQANARAAELLRSVRALHDKAAEQNATGLVLFAVAERLNPVAPGGRFGMVYDISGVQPVLKPEEYAALNAPRQQAAQPDANDAAAVAAAEAARKAQAEANAKFFAEVLAREPDYLFVVDRYAAFGEPKARELMEANPAITASKAWKENRVVYLDSDDGAAWYLFAGSLPLLEHSIAHIQAVYDKND